MNELDILLDEESWLLEIDTDWESGIKEYTWNWDNDEHPPLEEGRKELADLRTRIAELEAEKELFELRSKQAGKSRIELYREIFNLSDYIKHIVGISNTSVQHYWPDTCETCKEIRLELEKNDSRINRLLGLLED